MYSITIFLIFFFIWINLNYPTFNTYVFYHPNYLDVGHYEYARAGAESTPPHPRKSAHDTSIPPPPLPPTLWPFCTPPILPILINYSSKVCTKYIILILKKSMAPPPSYNPMCSQNTNNQIVNIADKNPTEHSFLSRYH